MFVGFLLFNCIPPWVAGQNLRVRELQSELQLVANPSGDQEVGTTITWTAVSSNSGDTKWRFSAKKDDGDYKILRDFDMYNSATWTPLEEGEYTVRVTAFVGSSEFTATEEFEITSRVASGSSEAVVSSTSHPLVALYSAPPCAAGKDVKVQFRPVGGFGNGGVTTTPSKPCGNGGRSVNFLIAGMMSMTGYKMRHIVAGESPSTWDDASNFITGVIDGVIGESPPFFNVTKRHENQENGLIMHSILFRPLNGTGDLQNLCPVATDLDGNIVWYYNEPCINIFSIMKISFPHPNGEHFLVHASRPETLPAPPYQELLREVDLVGNIVRETNVDHINSLLSGMGMRPIHFFHHDSRYLPNGHILVMAGVERLVEGVQGEGIVDVMGDMILVLDEDLQLVWAWDSTDDHPKLPLSRRALRDEPCVNPVTCGPLKLVDQTTCPTKNDPNIGCVRDWTHGNAVTYTPEDGNFLVSFRHQDWIIKVDYADGNGSGDIIWRLGYQGDFTIVGENGTLGDDWWFSGQHLPLIYGGNELVVFDNRNPRDDELPQPPPFAPSRGQVYLLNESTMEATLDLSVDLGGFAPFVGSSQKLSNGNYHFGAGALLNGKNLPPMNGGPPGTDTESFEVDSHGEIVYTIRSPDIGTYRTFCMKNIYKMDEAE